MTVFYLHTPMPSGMTFIHSSDFSPPLAKEMREVDECDRMGEFDTLDGSERTIAILGDGWWPQAAKQEGDKIRNKFLCNVM